SAHLCRRMRVGTWRSLLGHGRHRTQRAHHRQRRHAQHFRHHIGAPALIVPVFAAAWFLTLRQGADTVAPSKRDGRPRWTLTRREWMTRVLATAGGASLARLF